MSTVNIFEQRGWLTTLTVCTYNPLLRSLPRLLNSHSHLASGDLNKSHWVEQGLTVVSLKTTGDNDPCFFHTLAHVMKHI